MSRVEKVYFLIFIHISMHCMDMVPVQSKWHLLAPDMLVKISNELDFCSYENVRRCCIDFYRHIKPKDYYVGFDRSIYFHELGKKRNIIFKAIESIQEYLKPKKTMEELYKEMDVETYTRKMIFFVRHNFRDSEQLRSFTNETNKEETEAVLMQTLLYKQSNGVEIKFPIGLYLYFNVYRKNDLDTLFKAYAQDFQQNKRDDRTPSNYFGGIQIIRVILHSTMNVNFQNEECNTMLHCAKHPEQLRYLLVQPHIDLNICNKKGETPLHYAIAHPTIEKYDGAFDVCACISVWYLAETLLKDERTDIRAQTNKGKTILHYAAKYGSDDKGSEFLGLTTEKTGFYIFKLLLAKLEESDFFVVDNVGRTPLHVATKYNNLKVIEYALNVFPALRLLHYKEGQTFLDYAIKKNISLKDNISKPEEGISADNNISHADISSENKKEKSWTAFIFSKKKLMIVGSLAIIAAFLYMKK